MDDRLRISLWIVSGGGVGAVLGGAFGGLTGALCAQSGRAAGTGFGRRIADAFTRTKQRERSPVRQGAITGTADGVLFLGIVGIVAGALVGVSGRAAEELLVPAMLGSLLMVGGAMFFGVLSYGIIRNGVWAILYIAAGGFGGAFLAGILLGADRCLIGVVPGLVAGLTLSFVARSYAPEFHPPHVGGAAPRRRLDAKPDITRTPQPRGDDDSFRKPGPFEED